MADNKQLQQAREAPWDMVDSFRGTSQTVVDSIMAIRELNRKFAQSLLLNWVEMLTPQRRQPTQKQQAPFQRLMSASIRKSGKGLVLRIYHPKQVRPDAPQNQELEGLVSEVVTHSDTRDLQMRFFGNPDVEAVPARITGRRLDPYEPPRDLVIVAFCPLLGSQERRAEHRLEQGHPPIYPLGKFNIRLTDP
jgi:hypothetical protein